VDIRFLGHAAFELTDEGVTVLIDPFLSGNQKAAAGAEAQVFVLAPRERHTP
jgi:L-ascorbate metabolism protein UlaG (beta-lactamase superfamily)